MKSFMKNLLITLEGVQRVHISAKREIADAMWKGHTLLKTGLSAHRYRQTKVKTVYPPVSLRLLGRYNNVKMTIVYNSAYVQTENLNFTFAQQAVIVYFDAER